MKNQHVSTIRKIGTVLLTAMMVAVLALCLSLTAFAAEAGSAPAGTFSKVTFAKESGIVYHSAVGIYTKVYDGASQIDPAHIQLEVVGQTDEKKPTDVSASFVSPTKTDPQSSVGEAKICITYKWEGVQKQEYLSARINARNLSWGDFSLTLPLTYDPTPGITSYQHAFTEEELASVSVDSLVGILPEDAGKLSILSIEKVSVSTADFNTALNDGTTLRKHLKVTLDGEKKLNYTVNDLDVVIDPTPIQFTEVIWKVNGENANGPLEFSYGDTASRLITAVGKINETTYLDMVVTVKGTELPPLLADEATYGAVKEGAYVLVATSSDPVHYALSGAGELSVTFKKAVCEIQVKDAVFEGDAEHEPTFYPLSIVGMDKTIPHDVLTRIKYSYTLDGKTFVDVPSAPGKYTVHFSLAEEDAKNYTLKVTEAGEGADGVITVKILPYSLTAGIEDGHSDVIIFCEKGSLEGVSAKLSAFEPAPALLKRFTVYKSFSLSVTGVKKGDSFRFVIPVHSSLLSDGNTKGLTDADLYVVSGEEMKAAKEQYKVTLSENGSYYLVEGVAFADSAEITLALMIAPAYNVSFWATVPGVALIILLVLLAVLALALIGLKLLRVEKRDVNPTLTIETEGDAPKVEPTTAPDKLGSADECIDENLENLEASLREDVAPARAEAPDVSEDAAAMAATMVASTAEEAAALSLVDDKDARDIEEIDQMTTTMADERAAELSASMSAEPDGIASDDADLTAAVDEAIDEAVTVEDSAEESAPKENAPTAVGETIDSIVTEALSALVEIPDGLLDREAPESVNEGDSLDAGARAAASVKEAIRVITVGGAELKKREDCTKDALEKAVSIAAKQSVPADWTQEYAKEVTDAITAALEKAIL